MGFTLRKLRTGMEGQSYFSHVGQYSVVSPNYRRPTESVAFTEVWIRDGDEPQNGGL